jgi:hypothetical protein
MLPAQEKSSMNIDALQETAINAVELFCGIISRPVELVLRPWHGTRYFQPTVIFCSTMLMILIPAFSTALTGIGSMIPFTRFVPPPGMFGMGSFATLYFALSFLHGIRIYRRMVHMELEEQSEYEGGPLPFIHLIPGAKSFWLTRILIEPALLFIAATLLQDIYVIQSGLSSYLHFAALTLAMKGFVGWYRSWEFLRKILDARNAGPIIAKLIDDQATQDDLARIHLASFPRDIEPEVRQTVANFIARAFSTTTDNSNAKGESHDAH